MNKAYESNLTQDQWQLIEPLIPSALPPRRKRSCEVCLVLNAIFYVSRPQSQPRNLPLNFQGLA